MFLTFNSRISFEDIHYLIFIEEPLFGVLLSYEEKVAFLASYRVCSRQTGSILCAQVIVVSSDPISPFFIQEGTTK